MRLLSSAGFNLAKLALGGVILIVPISACEAQTATRVVGGHSFQVPRARLVTPNFPGLIFVLNPEKEVSLQKLVLVQSREALCVHSRNPSQLSAICNARNPNARFSAMAAGGAVTKRFRPDSKIQSSYQFVGGDALEVAECSEAVKVAAVKLENADAGALCSSMFAYQSLIVKISFRERDVAALPKLVENASSLLASWELK